MAASIWEYPLALVASAGLTAWLTPLARRQALRRDILDRPGPIKVQAAAVPYLGGLAVAASFSVISLLSLTIGYGPGDWKVVAGAVGLGLGLSGLGLVDDLRDLPIWPRLAVQAAAGAVVVMIGIRANVRELPGGWDDAATVVWVVGVTNAFNLLDNMDGLSGGVAAIAAAGMAGVAILGGDPVVGVLALALAGSCVGFLRHNLVPARIYMGDAGSLLIGFVLAVLALRLRTPLSSRTTFMVPLLILAVPIFDTSLVVVTRALRRSNPVRGGLDHVSHRLVGRGLSVRAAVTIIYAATLGTVALGLVASRLSRGTGIALAAAVAVVGLGAGAVLARVRVARPVRG